MPTGESAGRRAVVTGYGVATTRGSGIEPAWEALAAAQPAGRDYTPDGGTRPFFAAPLPDDYRPAGMIPRNIHHVLDRGSLLALDAALQALAAARLEHGAGDARRFAVADGLAYRAPGQATLFVPYGHLIARVTGVRGPVVVTGGAEASGMAAIAGAVRLVVRGEADVAIAGAAQALQEPVLAHLASQGWTAPMQARPFDVDHAGFVPAEAAAYVVVEDEEHARARGVEPIANIAGVGETFDPLVEPLETSGPAEAGRAMQNALANAGYLQSQVDHVVSCADGRPAVDAAEAAGLMRTFGRHAYYAGVTTAAGALGHALAASGPLSLVLALASLQRQQVTPIAGFERGPDGVEVTYVREARAERLDCVLVTSLGLGGTNVSVLLQR
ncbi:MAG: beta-ketoacyl-ACP synthase II [Dehalococcoidia bacterium]